jgi:hypothetical protein
MKETVRSLRWYFGILGALGIAGHALSASTELGQPELWPKLDWLFTGAVFVTYLYSAFTLPQLLRRRPRLLLGVNALCQVRWIISFVVAISGTLSPARALGTLIVFTAGLSVLRYLQRNLKRLAAEHAPRPQALSACPECGDALGGWRDRCECGYRFVPVPRG